MDRLTVRNTYGAGVLRKPAVCERCGEMDYGPIDEDGNRVAERLAAYEDSGLTPEEVAELARAKDEGRMLILPCALGTPVYRLYNTRGCVNCEKFHSACDGISCPEPKIAKQELRYEHLGALQDTFLTREAAEAALTKAAANTE